MIHIDYTCYSKQLVLLLSKSIINYDQCLSQLMEFKRFQIPPDFYICRLHQQAALIYDANTNYTHKCPCCQRSIGSNKIPLCSRTQKLMRISDQIPLYFSSVKVVFVMLLFYMAALVGQLNFSSTVQPITCKLSIPQAGIQTIQLGFIESNRLIRFLYFCGFTLVILTIRGYLKKCKYEVKKVVDKISYRSVMLFNVNPRATTEQILQVFSRDDIQGIVLTYRAKNYSDCLQSIYRLKKQLYIATHQKRKSYQNIDEIKNKIQDLIDQAKYITDDLRNPNNRLDFVFMTFRSEQSKQKFMVKYHTNILMRLFYKLCACCSKSSIRGQHVSVTDAPDPEDIDWLNLQTSYWTKKYYRMACYYMSFGILIYGIMFQYEIDTFSFQSFYDSIIKSFVVFVVNFFIINLLEYTTYEIEKHEINTNKILSLIKKLTFFIFLNLSMSPIIVYIYSQYLNSTGNTGPTSSLDNLGFSVLVICIGNVLKPVLEYFNVQRITRYIGFRMQLSKRLQSEMTQEEANLAFEPIPFPIASFYSMLISSLLLTSFFLSSFQLLIVIELIACGLLFILSKSMLLKICKQPIGLSNQIGILSQRLLAFAIYIYWIGDKVMYFFLVSQQNNTFGQYIGNYSVYDIIELGILLFVFMLSPKLMSLISHKLTDNQSISQSFIQKANLNENRMNYEDVNSIKKIQAQYLNFFREMV